VTRPGDISRSSIALVRGVPDSFAGCELTWIDRVPIDVAAARQSHAAYVAILEASGLRVVRLPPDEAHPDCPFVEDLLIEVGGRRVLCNPGAPSRRGERAAFAGWFDVAMPDDLRLDGGDVLQVAGRVFVGTTTRTDPAAVAWLRDLVDVPVIAVDPGPGALHLKTAATPIDDDTVLSAPLPGLRAAAPDLEIVDAPPGEGGAANVLRLPDGGLIVAAGAPRTVALLRARGLRVRTLDIEPFTRAEAGLTCLSVLLRGES